MGNQIRTTILLAVLTAFILWVGQLLGGAARHDYRSDICCRNEFFQLLVLR